MKTADRIQAAYEAGKTIVADTLHTELTDLANIMEQYDSAGAALIRYTASRALTLGYEVENYEEPEA